MHYLKEMNCLLSHDELMDAHMYHLPPCSVHNAAALLSYPALGKLYLIQ